MDNSAPAKNLLQSKTFWINVLGILAEVTGILPIPPEATLIIMSIVNIGLRVLSDTPVTILPKPKTDTPD